MHIPAERRSARFGLRGWRHPAILAVAGLSVASGFAQFGAVAALGDVAEAFGSDAAQAAGSIAAEVGLSPTTLGIGLAIIRLAAIGSLPLAAQADGYGRRRVLLTVSAVGLALTVAAAFSPGYWWFVALFALGRPLLSTTNALSGVVAAEETASADRAKAIAMVTAGYGLGAGLTGIVRAAGGEALGFRALFALSAVPLLCVPLLGRLLEEPRRYIALRDGEGRQAVARLGRVRRDLRPRLALVSALAFAIAYVTGPMNSFLFVYAENALGAPRTVTAAALLAAGPIGLGGLLAGRWAADRLGRRGTAAAGQAVVAVAGMITYSGTIGAAVGGYLLSIVAASVYAPAFGALAAEVFPTSVRATASGWLTAAGVVGAVAGLLAFGGLTPALGGFAPAAVAVCTPVVAAVGLFAWLPETRGQELEQSAPEATT